MTGLVSFRAWQDSNLQLNLSGLDQQNAFFSGFFTSTICDPLRSFMFMRAQPGPRQDSKNKGERLI